MDLGSKNGPLYLAVETSLAKKITTGHLKPNSQLPPEHLLGSEYGVSRPTIRQAIQNLVARGLLEIRRGKGTFVSEPKITQELTHLTGFVEDMTALGLRPSARLIKKEIVAANNTVARNLSLPVGSPVVRIQRVRLANDIPISFDETFLPQKVGKKILFDDLEAQPIFSLLEKKYDLPLVDAIYRLEAVVATKEVAKALQIPIHAPIFMIERTSYTLGKSPIDYEKLFYRGDMIRFETRLHRNQKAPRKPSNGK